MVGRIAAFFLVFLSSQAYPFTLYVGPTGSDAFNGVSRYPSPSSGNGPLASLDQAKNVIRSRRAKGERGEIRVIVASGNYYLERPFILDRQDSGEKGGRIVYQAEKNAKPKFSSAVSITDFASEGDGIISAIVPHIGGDRLYFEQLYVNGKRAVRARSPNKDNFFAITNIVSQVPSSRDLDAERRRSFYLPPQALASLSNVSSEDLRNVEVQIYHAWEISRLKINSVDKDSGLLLLQGSAKWPFLKWGEDQRFFFENFRAALDEGGEWYLDRGQGKLYYKLRPGEDISSLEVSAPRLDQLLLIQGSSEPGGEVHDIVIEGLQFEGADAPHLEEGYSDPQAAIGIPGTIQIDNARRIVLKNCRVAKAGGYGVWLRRNVQESAVIQSVFEDLGAGGIRVGEAYLPKSPSWATGSNVISDNRVIGLGNVYPAAVGIWVGQSSGNRISHNEIRDAKYSGISVGWTYGYGRSDADRNVIEFNRIENIGQGELSDMAGIYLLGIAPGTVVRNNVIKDVKAFRYGGWGLYADEGTSHVVFENNLVVRAQSGGFHIHFGKENIVRNNIFAFSDAALLERTRGDENQAVQFEGNIFYWVHGPLVKGKWDDKKVIFKNNFFFVSKPDGVSFNDKDLKRWQASGLDENSRFVDPGFMDPDHDDFSFMKDSAAIRAGFKPFDPNAAGLSGASGVWR